MAWNKASGPLISLVVLFPLESASLILHILGSFRCVFTVVFALFSLVYPHYTVKVLSKCCHATTINAAQNGFSDCFFVYQVFKNYNTYGDHIPIFLLVHKFAFYYLSHSISLHKVHRYFRQQIVYMVLKDLV